jgi:hypothetical protein
MNTSSGGSGYGSSSKKAERDALLWRCTGNALGLDSRDAPVPCPVHDGQAVAAAHIPKARSATPQEIQQWMVDDFEVLPNFQTLRGGSDKPFKVGDVVLWRNTSGVPKLTALRGVVEAVHFTDNEGVVLYVIETAMQQNHRIPVCYVEQDTTGWLAGRGGRCYRAIAVMAYFKEQVLCPECAKWQISQWAYEAHYPAKHPQAAGQVHRA